MEKFALITGGSSGIGKAIAMQLADKGYSLLLVSNQEDELNKCVLEFNSTTCIPICMDLANAQSAVDLFERINDLSIRVEVLVNNAGFLVFSEVTDTAIIKMESLLILHMNTPALLCKLFGKEMQKKGSGYILNVSSISSVMPFPGISLYGPTKTFLRYFTRALRHELKVYGIKVCCLLPGATATALYDPKKINFKLAKSLGIMHSAEFVAAKAVKDLLRGKAECVPGIINKLTVWFVPIVPKGIIHFLHRKTGITKKGVEVLA